MDNASFLQDLFGMQGQVAVVVGGAGALGLCLATGLGKNGAKIVVADMNEDACKTAVEKLSAEGIEAIYKTVNV
ncbi:MAG: SDR family NAD(P)-dependent oxidoreductase, partial [Thermoguttaceae bacterium]|nr:SDR family NAD(P)-dependent oxidoreductase [Thermoguttaceae bacterium]